VPPRRLTGHAIDRLRQRGISREDIESALNREFRRRPGETGSVWIWGYSTTGATLKVCVATDDESRVITAVWPG
jgi:hypothetical protein